MDRTRAACETYTRRVVAGEQQPYLIVAAASELTAVARTAANLVGSDVPLFVYTAALCERDMRNPSRPTRVGTRNLISVVRRNVDMAQALRAVSVRSPSLRPQDSRLVEVESGQTCSMTTGAVVISGAVDATALSSAVAHSLAHLLQALLRASLSPYLGQTHLEVVAVDAVELLPVGPSVLIYDSFEGGMGLAEVALDLVETLFADAYRILVACPCRVRVSGLPRECGVPAGSRHANLHTRRQTRHVALPGRRAGLRR